MRRTLIVATCLVLAGMASQATHAAIIAGQYVPDGLVGQTGTQYRLIFVTSGSIQAESDDPAVYDQFLAEQVAGTMLGSYDYGWKAVISTQGAHRTAKNIVSDAAYNVDANKYAGVFNTMGIKVAETGDSMLAGSLSSPVLLSPVLYDQNCTSVYDGYAWTGSYSNGEAYLTVPPGQVGDDYGSTVVGNPGANNGSWLQLGNVSRTVNLDVPYGNFSIPFVARIYGMSNVLEVPVVPEPATFVMWSLLAGIGSVVFWRRRRQGN